MRKSSQKSPDALLNLLTDPTTLHELEHISKTLLTLQKKHHLSSTQLTHLISRMHTHHSQKSIPLSCYSHKGLGILEATTKHLKENQGLSFSEIGRELYRNEKTIWASYKQATAKLPTPLITNPQEIYIPLTIFRNRRLGVLESLALYLKDHYHFTFSKIGHMLNRDQRNIWSVYHNAKKKYGK